MGCKASKAHRSYSSSPHSELTRGFDRPYRKHPLVGKDLVINHNVDLPSPLPPIPSTGCIEVSQTYRLLPSSERGVVHTSRGHLIRTLDAHEDPPGLSNVEIEDGIMRYLDVYIFCFLMPTKMRADSLVFHEKFIHKPPIARHINIVEKLYNVQFQSSKTPIDYKRDYYDLIVVLGQSPISITQAMAQLYSTVQDVRERSVTDLPLCNQSLREYVAKNQLNYKGVMKEWAAKERDLVNMVFYYRETHGMRTIVVELDNEPHYIYSTEYVMETSFPRRKIKHTTPMPLPERGERFKDDIERYRHHGNHISKKKLDDLAKEECLLVPLSTRIKLQTSEMKKMREEMQNEPRGSIVSKKERRRIVKDQVGKMRSAYRQWMKNTAEPEYKKKGVTMKQHMNDMMNEYYNWRKVDSSSSNTSFTSSSDLKKKKRTKVRVSKKMVYADDSGNVTGSSSETNVMSNNTAAGEERDTEDYLGGGWEEYSWSAAEGPEDEDSDGKYRDDAFNHVTTTYIEANRRRKSGKATPNSFQEQGGYRDPDAMDTELAGGMDQPVEDPRYAFLNNGNRNNRNKSSSKSEIDITERSSDVFIRVRGNNNSNSKKKTTNESAKRFRENQN